MKAKNTGTRLFRVHLIVLVNFWLASNTWAATQFKVLHAFGSGTDGGGLYAGVTFDRKGNLYGVTSGGGALGDGIVFKLKPQPDGSWTERILHSFDFHQEGASPSGNLLVDQAGNVYGTGYFGGKHNGGSIFELVPGPNWSEEILYSFGDNGDGDGGGPYAGLIEDSAGNLYGTTVSGFPPDAQDGTVYELTPGPTGWTESVLYRFCSKPDCADGKAPYGELSSDEKGNLYGTTEGGGRHPPACPVNNGCGVVFKLRRINGDGWKYRVLHRFAAFPDDGQNPGGGQLALDGSGSLYGTTIHGGTHYCNGGCGTIFKLTPQPNGQWKESILYNFKPGKSGNGPGAGVTIDKMGNLYGTTVNGGTDCDCGVVYKLSPNPDGTWTYSVLHRFSGSDGAQPDANMILDDQGNLYGTAVTGGAGGYGVVFEITP